MGRAPDLDERREWVGGRFQCPGLSADAEDLLGADDLVIVVPLGSAMGMT